MSGFTTRSASAASQGGAWSNNPAHLPLVLSSTANKVKLKYGPTSVALDDTNGGIAAVGAFVTAVNKSGAAVEIAATDTWTTVCDLTGAGFLTAAIGPTCNTTASFEASIRVTVDGVEYVFSSASAPVAYSRLVLGGIPALEPIINTTSASAGDGDYNDIGFGGASTHNGIFVSESIYIPTPNRHIASGVPACRFEQSLKVEVKCSVLGSSQPVRGAYAVYQLDKNS